MKQVLVISSSPRKGGNSERLCEEFARGAREAGHNAEVVYLRDHSIGYCRGCYACKTLGHCVQKDDAETIAKKMLAADVIAFGTPVYFYTMSAQLKTLIDRLVPHYEKIRADIYLFATAWDPDRKMLELTLESIRGCTRDCFEDCTEKGALAVGNVHQVGDIRGREELTTAFEMGLFA